VGEATRVGVGTDHAFFDGFGDGRIRVAQPLEMGRIEAKFGSHLSLVFLMFCPTAK
jgi:hypothetical protein